VYNNILPSVNVKYALSDDQNLRFAASLTNTLPEFKEIAEFNYVSPTGQGTLGNPDIEKSDNLNVDFKYEYFPTSGQLVSGALFFKNIQNPINKALRKGSTGWYTYDNTADDAYALGLEVEGKFDVREGETYNLKTAFNFSYMFTRQNLTEDYQYSDVTTARLQGASDFIGNASLIYEMGEDDKKFVSTLTGNYASDKIAVLGSSTNAGAFSGTLFNNNIIEKGFVTLDFVAKKNLSEKLTLSFVAKNILDPKIRQTQEISTVTSVEDITVSEYRRGRLLTLGLSYIF